MNRRGPAGARRDLSLHHIIARDISAAELVPIAADLGCRYVCLVTQDAGRVPFPIVRDLDLAALRRVMDGCGVTAYGVTSFEFNPDTDVGAFEAGVSRGAQLGASVANARIVDADEPRVIDNFGAFGDLCARYVIRPCIEFTGLGNTGALPQALRILSEAKCGGLSLDALHIVRTQTSFERLRSLAPELIGYAQLCDGPRRATAADYRNEGANDRLPPGEGEFPLGEFVSIVPAHLPLSLEVPSERLRIRGVSARERARRVVEATRRLLTTVEKA